MSSSSTNSTFASASLVLLSVMAGLLFAAAGAVWYFRVWALESEARFMDTRPIKAEVTSLEATPLTEFGIGTTSGGTSLPKFLPKAHFRYTVADKVYEGEDTLSLASPFDSAEAARAAAETQLPVGKEINVYYKPADPGRAKLNRVTEPTNTGRVTAQATAVLVLLGIVTLLVRSHWKRWWQTHTPAPAVGGGCSTIGCVGLVALPMMFIGGCFLLTGVNAELERRRLDRWKPIEAVVLESRFDLERGRARTKNSPATPTRYTPRVRYQYWREGPRSSDQIYIDGATNTYSTEGEVEAALAPYPVGRKVTAYIDSEDPIRVALKPELSESSGNSLPIGLGLFGLGLSIVVVTWRGLKKGSAPHSITV